MEKQINVSELKVSTETGTTARIYNNGNMQARVNLSVIATVKDVDTNEETLYQLTEADWATARIVPYENASYDAPLPAGWAYSHDENEYAHHIKIMAGEQLPIISNEELMKGIQVVKPGEKPQASVNNIPQTRPLWVTCKDKIETQLLIIVCPLHP